MNSKNNSTPIVVILCVLISYTLLYISWRNFDDVKYMTKHEAKAWNNYFNHSKQIQPGIYAEINSHFDSLKYYFFVPVIYIEGFAREKI